MGQASLHVPSVNRNVIHNQPKKVTEDAQGEAQGDPITLEGGDSANVDGLPHSGMLEQVSNMISFT